MVYPNPINSTFDIDVAEDVALGIIVFNSTLEKVKQIKRYKAKTGINVLDWPNGDYIVHIYHGTKHVKEQKFKVEH